MKYFVLAAGILLAALVGLATPAFAEEGKVIDGSETKAISSGLEEKSEPEEKSGPKSAGLKFPGFGIGLTMGFTSALATTEGSSLLADGGGVEVGIMIGAYPLLFGELGGEFMRFDLTTEADKEANQKVRIEMYGFYAGVGGGLPFEGFGIGYRWRVHRKNQTVLEIENKDTEQTDLFRDKVTRHSYFIFVAFGGEKGKDGRKGPWGEIGFRYDNIDKNVFL
ncbi:MAG: hypothetical protein V3S64_02845, partial [bacterium]